MALENLSKVKTFLSQHPGVNLVVATKNQNVETLNFLKEKGLNVFGENKVQEFLEKCHLSDVSWHFIGRLQTNKVKFIVGKVALIHSVDSAKLLDKIESECEKKNVSQDILIEVNISEESQKGGISQVGLNELLEYSLKLERVNLRGIMAMMPLGNTDESLYIKAKEIFSKYSEKIDGFDFLSMGMSGDYEMAVKHGSNIIRLGRAVFN